MSTGIEKVKNIYYDDSEKNGTGLFIETGCGKFYKHQLTDPVMPFERISKLPNNDR